MVIACGGHDQERAATIDRIDFPPDQSGLDQPRNEFSRAVIAYHELFSQFPDADVLSGTIGFDDEQSLVPLHRETDICGCLLAERQKLTKSEAEIRERSQFVLSRRPIVFRFRLFFIACGNVHEGSVRSGRRPAHAVEGGRLTRDWGLGLETIDHAVRAFRGQGAPISLAITIPQTSHLANTSHNDL